jgi:hypothetical protein
MILNFFSCQSQHDRKQVQQPRSNQQYDRTRSFPSQQTPQYRQPQSYNTSAYSDSHDVYNNGHKHSNSAPMIVRRKPPE